MTIIRHRASRCEAEFAIIVLCRRTHGTQAIARNETPPNEISDHASPESGETVLVAWRIHPLRENPRGIAPVAGAYALAFILWRVLFPYPLGLILPVVALTGALSEYLLPTTYRLTTRGAHADGGLSRLFIAWTDVRRATRGADGVHLSPFSRPSRLDNFRGVRLKFAGGNPDQIVATIQEQRQAHSPTRKTTDSATVESAAMPVAEAA